MTEQDNKIFVRIDLDVVKQLQNLAKPQEISPDLITKVIQHACVCEKWCAEQEKKE